MMEIGLMYEGHVLGEPDFPQAIYWFKKAADTGNPQAEKKLKDLYATHGNLNAPTLSLDTSKGLGEALTPAVEEMTGKTVPKQKETPASNDSKIMDYLTGKLKDKDMLADPTMSDGQKSILMSLMSIKRLKKIAKTGNTTAQNQLGIKYYDDEKDAKNALYWFMAAAKSGHDTAVTNAAAALGSDQVSKSKRDEAIGWMRVQADQGRTPAQLVIGKFYKDGLHDFPEDKTIGFAWIEKAANNGSSNAQFELGFAQMLGNDVAEDKQSGFQWLSKSAAQGNSRGEYWLADAYRDGDGVAKNDTLALKWFKKAHNSGHSSAALQIVFIYRDENSTEQNDDKTREWVEIMIATDGSSVGYQFAGDMYLNGRGYPQNDRLAFENYEISAQKDNGTAQYKLAIMLLEGRGTAQDTATAIEWLKKAKTNYSYEAGAKLKELGIVAE